MGNSLNTFNYLHPFFPLEKIRDPPTGGQISIKLEILRIKNCTKTNSSGWVEYTKAQGIILFKELGKIAPYVRKKEFL